MKTVVGVLGAHPLRRGLEFEPVAEHEVVALRRVGPERLLLLRGGPRLDLAHRHLERIVDLLQPGVGARNSRRRRQSSRA